MSSEDLNVTQEQLQQEEYIYDPVNQPDVDVVNGGAILINFLKNLRPGADLVGALAPTFSLKPYSFLEWISVLLEPKEFLLEIAKTETPQQRMAIVLRYILEGTSTMPQSGVQQVKGYNSILGETFDCSWKHENSTTTFISEQVSHHPPISAGYFENKTAGIQIEVIFQPKIKFVGNILGPYVQSHIEGNAYLHIPSLNEVYRINFPYYVCRNLLLGGSYCELNDELKITSSSGYEAIVNFKSKSDNKVTGEIRFKKDKITTFDGVSNDKVFFKSGEVLLDTAKIVHPPKTVKSLSEQEINESRRVWHRVTMAIHSKNLDLATKYKTLIEEAERKIKKEREENRIEWTPKNFYVLKTDDGKSIELGNSTNYYRFIDFDKFQSSDKAE